MYMKMEGNENKVVDRRIGSPNIPQPVADTREGQIAGWCKHWSLRGWCEWCESGGRHNRTVAVLLKEA